VTLASKSSRRSFLGLCVILILLATGLGLFQGIKYRNFLAELWDIPTSQVNIYKSDYWMGELVENIVEHGEYRACYPDRRSAQPATVGLCFSAHRMPVVTLFMVAVTEVFNNVVFLVTLKAAICMILLCVSMWFIALQASDWRPVVAALTIIYLVDPANALILIGPVSEESVLVPQMALAGALLFAGGMTPDRMTTRRLIVIAVLVALMPMTKTSSLLPAVVIAGLVGVFARRGRLAPLLPAAALVAVLVAWGGFTYHMTGHFASGSSLSSLNGYNLHHGYTKYYGEVAPRYNLDLPVSRGQIKLDAPVHNEWEFNKQFTDRAFKFMRENPGTSAWYLVIKTYVAIFKLTPEYQPYNGQDGFFLPKHLILTAGLTLDRLVLWLSLGMSVVVMWTAWRKTGWKSYMTNAEVFSAVALFTVTLAFLAPFIIAFASFRHLVPVYYFGVAYLATQAVRWPSFRRFGWHGGFDHGSQSTK
jgi:hypothetical protein